MNLEKERLRWQRRKNRVNEQRRLKWQIDRSKTPELFKIRNKEKYKRYREQLKISSFRWYEANKHKSDFKKKRSIRSLRYYYLNKEKELARGKLTKAVNRGKIIRPNECEVCKKEIKVEGHHHDYNKPFDVRWLCKKCHEAVHHPPHRSP